MINQKRLTRIETSLTPKQAVLLWLRQEHQDKTMHEYARWLVQLPPYMAPRTHLGRQVESAIRVAMNGQDPVRIERAVRQGQMQAEFLILLVNRTNSAILDDSRSRGLQIALLLERLRSASLWNEETAKDWLLSLRELVTELSSIHVASEGIRDQYFDGQCILFEDAIKKLEEQTLIVQSLMADMDRGLIKHGHAELAIPTSSAWLCASELPRRSATLLL